VGHRAEGRGEIWGVPFVLLGKKMGKRGDYSQKAPLQVGGAKGGQKFPIGNKKRSDPIEGKRIRALGGRTGRQSSLQKKTPKKRADKGYSEKGFD